MNNKRTSKAISKTDDSGKEFIMKLLDGDFTYGFDIDSIYYTNDGWVVIELLKCDTVSPHNSHPHRYPMNWKKFASLVEASKKLKGKLWLVNYSTIEEWKDQVRLLVVDGIDYYALKDKYVDKNNKPRYLNYLNIISDEKLTFDEFKIKYRELNKKATQPWESKI